MAVAEGRALESHLDGAVAKKNFNLSKCASLSCSSGFKARERPPERPGVDVVYSLWMPWPWGCVWSREEREDEEGGYSLGAPLVVVAVVVVEL